MTTHVMLVHGAWHGAWAWDLVRAELENIDLVVHTVDLPSSGSGSLGDLHGDVEVVRHAVDQVGAPLTLVGHSYGGAVISGASAGNDAVQSLVYVAAFMLPEQVSILDAVGGQAPPWWSVDEATGSVGVIDPRAVFYGGCPEAVVESSVARLGRQSLASFTQANPEAGWQDRPTAYIVCEQDAAIPSFAQDQMSAAADSVHRLDCSHSPFLCHPQQVAEIIGQTLTPA